MGKNKYFVNIQIDSEELEDAILELPETVAIKLIKDVDGHQQSWSFTKALYEYFSKEYEQYKKDFPNEQ